MLIIRLFVARVKNVGSVQSSSEVKEGYKGNRLDSLQNRLACEMRRFTELNIVKIKHVSSPGPSKSLFSWRSMTLI